MIALDFWTPPPSRALSVNNQGASMRSLSTTLLSILFLAATSLCAGQDLRSRGIASLSAAPPIPPPYCSPCLFYGGDFDPANSAANGLEDDKVLTWGLMPNVVYIPFDVPASQQWTVRGLFVNVLSTES